MFGFICQSYGGITNRDITALTPVNHAPKIKGSAFIVAESIGLDSTLGRVEATDEDNEVLAYSIKSGNINSIFAIGSSTGLITVVKHLDHHTQDSFNLLIKVSDPGGLSDESSVIINVTAAEKLPAFSSIAWEAVASQPLGTHEVHGESVNGKLYVFGGYDVQKRPRYVPTKRAFVYDPRSKTWSPIADLPHKPNGVNFGGITHEGVTSDGTDIYLAGGYPWNSAGTAQAFSTNEVWRYNVSSNTYTPLPKLPLPLATGQLRYLKGKLHYMGGANKFRRDTTVHYALDLSNLAAGWQALAPLFNGTNHAGSAVFEGKIYYIGGAHFQDAKSIKQKSVQVYNPETNSWKPAADLPVPLDHIASSVTTMGDRIIVLGGEASPNKKTNVVLAYSPAEHKWTSLTPLPVERAAGVGAVLNGSIYYAGGGFSNVNLQGTPHTQDSVLSFTLINADLDEPIKTLNNGDTLNLTILPTKNLSILVNTNPLRVGSVEFDLAGAQTVSVIENKAPYVLFGDNGKGDYFAWTPVPGKYVLKAQSYSSSAAGGIKGIGKNVNFTVTSGRVPGDTLLANADAFVRNGDFDNLNYGIDTTVLQVKSSPTARFSRHSYLQFSLSSVRAVDSAILRLYGRNASNASGILLSVYGVKDDSWKENGIKFNNAPAVITSPLSSTIVTDVPEYYDFDITDFVKTEFAGDKMVSLLIKDPKTSDKILVFNSRENLHNPPQLCIVSGSNIKNRGNINTGHSSNATSYATKWINKNFALPVPGDSKSKVYPNPMRKTFTIRFADGNPGAIDLQIVDAAGKMYDLNKSQLRQGRNNMVIDVSKLFLKPGIYSLRIHSATKQTETIKLMVK